MTRPPNIEDYYPALEDNPWTFIAPVLKHKIGTANGKTEGTSPNLLTNRGLALPGTREGARKFNEEFVVNIFDSSRWNYEMRVYLDLRGLWMPLFFSDKWQDINTVLRMLNDNLPRKFDISGDWWVRSPKMGDGTRIDLYLQGTFIARHTVVQPSLVIENQQLMIRPKVDERSDEEILGDGDFWSSYG